MITSVASAGAPPWRPDTTLKRQNHSCARYGGEIPDRDVECRRKFQATGSDDSEPYHQEETQEFHPKSVPYVPPKYIAPWKARAPAAPRYGAPWRSRNIPKTLNEDIPRDIAESTRYNTTLYKPRNHSIDTSYGLGYDQIGTHPPISTVKEQFQDAPSPLDQIADNLRGINSDGRPRILHLVRQIDPSQPTAGNFTRDESFRELIPEQVEPRQRPRFPWEMEKPPPIFVDVEPEARVRPPSLADLVVPDAELRRLRSQMVGLKERIKLKRLEITNAVVQGIHRRWKHSEIIKIKFEGPPLAVMKKMHEELERRTGGLVIWRGGSALVIYRGQEYTGPPVHLRSMPRPTEEEDKIIEESEESQHKENVDHVPFIETQYEKEMEIILEQLGPRYESWNGPKPVPVDGDKLPKIDHTYKKRYRLLPFGMEPKLSNVEMSNLRRIAKAMPPHFVLSRNKGLQGLAHAMVKLWEKSEIAKIAIKQDVMHTRSGHMADELKQQTGGILLGRDDQSMIFYRGKDFLPAEVAAAYEEREMMAMANEEDEDNARIMATSYVAEAVVRPTKRESEADAQLKEWADNEEEKIRRAQAEMSVRATRARRIEKQLRGALVKKKEAEDAIRKLENFIKPQEPEDDRETITEEERYTLQRLGLKMHASLLLGRRGVFSGIVENMHLHWKYRDLVKVIYNGKDRPDIHDTAKMLENESGGILVSITPTSKGAAMLFYRGKNYQRPAVLRPKHLLTKRKALEKYTVNQRRESLARHILSLEKDIRSYGYMLEKEKAVEDDESVNAYVEQVIHRKETKPLSRVVKRVDKTGLGPILRADPLTNRERLILRKRALLMRKTCQFHVGRCNVLRGLIVSMRLYMKKHALVKVGTKGRAIGTSVQEIAKLIEDGTGAAFVCQEKHKLIFYRGWPDGAEHPAYMEEDISPELISAVQEEDDDDFPFQRRFEYQDVGRQTLLPSHSEYEQDEDRLDEGEDDVESEEEASEDEVR